MKKKNSKDKKFHCHVCDYTTSRKHNLERHIENFIHFKKYVFWCSRKPGFHKNESSQLFDVINEKRYDKQCKIENNIFQCFCGYSFSKSGFWKHKKKCKDYLIYKQICGDYESITKDYDKESSQTFLEYCKIKIKEDENENLELVSNSKLREEMMTLKHENEKLKLQIELERSKSKPQNINITNNNNISINMLLNEKCKNALTFTDFIEQLQISITDLQYTKENGYVNGLSNIFIKQLKNLEPTERPIHCSDSKRSVFYIKDRDKWDKDKDNFKIDKSIHDIKIKQIIKLAEWDSMHPNWQDSTELTNERNALSVVYGEIEDKQQLKQVNQIKKNIGEAVDLIDIKNQF